MKQKTVKLAETAVLLALLLAFQFFTGQLGQLITGSLVNFTLICGAMVVGLWPGLTVAVISPVLAFLLGIGTPVLPIVPCIMLGNAVIVLIVWRFADAKAAGVRAVLRDGAAVLCGAAVKAAFLYLSVNKIVVPLCHIPEKQAAVFAAMFAWPQLFTALIGGAIAIAVSRPVMKALRNK